MKINNKSTFENFLSCSEILFISFFVEKETAPLTVEKNMKSKFLLLSWCLLNQCRPTHNRAEMMAQVCQEQPNTASCLSLRETCQKEQKEEKLTAECRSFLTYSAYIPNRGASSQINSAQGSDLKGLNLGLDIGHGCGADGICEPGAVGYVEERKHNEAQGELLESLLKQKGASVTVYKCDSPQASCSLTARGQQSRKHDLLISIHNNAAATANAQGTEVWTAVGHSNARIIGKMVNDKMSEHIWNGDSSFNRGIKHENFSVLRPGSEQHPVILTEGFFVSGKDLASNKSLGEQYSIGAAKGMADGVEMWFKNRNKSGLSLLLSSGTGAEEEWKISEPTIGILGH
jgi:N-acetylmuramoyl-L-alanine amidase